MITFIYYCVCYFSAQFTTDMDSLELHLKLEKIDPALVPENSVKHKEEMYQKMCTDWSEVDTKGKQLIKDVSPS